MKVFFLFLLFPFISFSQKESAPKELPIARSAIATFKLEGSPDFLATDGDDVWILNIDRVEKLSAQSNKPLLTVSVPGACGAMVLGFNSLWVASCSEQAIYRLDRQTGKVISVIPCGVSDPNGEIMLAAGGGSVWVVSDISGVLTRINPETNKIQERIKVQPGSYCAVYDFDAVWISNTNSNLVQKVDPKTNLVTATIPVGKIPRFIAAGEKGIWTLNQGDGTVSRIDPSTNQVVATIDAKVPGTGGDIAAGAGLVWVRATKNRFLQTINPETNHVETIYMPLAGSGAVRVADHYVWVTAHDINTIWVLKK